MSSGILKTSKKYLRKKADQVLQDYIRAKHQNDLCWVCGERYIVCGHHFIPCSNSNATRYYLPNIIPICKECHWKVHTQPHLVEPIICFKLGESWYNELMVVKREGVKVNREWYQINLNVLENLLEDLTREATGDTRW